MLCANNELTLIGHRSNKGQTIGVKPSKMSTQVWSMPLMLTLSIIIIVSDYSRTYIYSPKSMILGQQCLKLNHSKVRRLSVCTEFGHVENTCFISGPNSVMSDLSFWKNKEKDHEKVTTCKSAIATKIGQFQVPNLIWEICSMTPLSFLFIIISWQNLFSTQI